MVTKNFVIDFGAPTNGTSNASPALDAWLAFAAANDGSELVMPAHPYHFASTNALTNGVKNATITATGASVDALFIGNAGLIQESWTQSARIQTVAVGATSVTVISAGGTLVGPADSSIFAIGQWIMLSGIGTQVPDSYPPNFQYFEYRKVTEISGSVISFAEPLRFSYKSTWPYVDASVATIVIGTSTLTCSGHPLAEGQRTVLTTSGTLPTGVTAGTVYYVKNLSGASFQLSTVQFGTQDVVLSGTQSGTHYFHSDNYDLAGPATIYGMLDVFDGTQVYTGLECTAAGSGIGCSGGKSLLMTGMAFTGNNGPSPSMGKSIIIRQCQIGEQNEVDKCVEYLEYDQCTATGIKQILIQSTAPRDLVIKGGTALTTLNGTAYNTTVQDSSIDVLIGGVLGFGRSDTLQVSNSTIGPVDPSSGTRVCAHFIALSAISFSNQVFTISNGAGNLGDALRLFIPGFKYAVGYTAASQVNIVDSNGNTYPFKVLDITQDAANTYIQTDLGGLPGGTFAGNSANAIFAYGVKTLIPASSFLAGINAFVEPPDAITPRHIRKPKYISHFQSTDWKFVR